MDHLEKEMIDIVNHHAKEKSQHLNVGGHKYAVITKKDTATLKTGLKRLAIALLTAFLFALSVFAFVATATATGYWAVVLFFSAIVLMFWVFILLYAQGISHTEGKGDSK